MNEIFLENHSSFITALMINTHYFYHLFSIEMALCYILQVALELTMFPGLISNLQFCSINFRSTGIIGIHHRMPPARCACALIFQRLECTASRERNMNEYSSCCRRAVMSVEFRKSVDFKYNCDGKMQAWELYFHVRNWQ